MDLLISKVNIMRLLFILPISLLLFSAQVNAADLLTGRPLKGTPLTSLTGSEEKKWYYPQEISDLKIKQTSDGTGIIKGIQCGECDYQIVKITQDTKVIVNGVKVNLLRARERAGQEAYIEFDRETAEVKHIYWSE